MWTDLLLSNMTFIEYKVRQKNNVSCAANLKFKTRQNVFKPNLRAMVHGSNVPVSQKVETIRLSIHG